MPGPQGREEQKEVNMAERLIVLLSDFGHKDPCVGQMKSVILQQRPEARIIDLCHELPRHDVAAAAFTLYRCFKDFPIYSVFMAVVDPGVGGKRRPILVITEDHFFLGPDNGIFSYIYQTETVRKVLHITSSHYFRQPVSNTFHGRDVFAPVAAWLAEGIEVEKFGDPIEDYVKLPVPAEKLEQGRIRGAICGADHFGNLITNVRFSTIKELAGQTKASTFSVSVAGKDVRLVGGGYEQKLPVFAILNSSNLIEIACPSAPATDFMGIRDFPCDVEIVPAK